VARRCNGMGRGALDVAQRPIPPVGGGECRDQVQGLLAAFAMAAPRDVLQSMAARSARLGRHSATQDEKQVANGSIRFMTTRSPIRTRGKSPPHLPTETCPENRVNLTFTALTAPCNPLCSRPLSCDNFRSIDATNMISVSGISES